MLRKLKDVLKDQEQTYPTLLELENSGKLKKLHSLVSEILNECKEPLTTSKQNLKLIIDGLISQVDSVQPKEIVTSPTNSEKNFTFASTFSSDKFRVSPLLTSQKVSPRASSQTVYSNHRVPKGRKSDFSFKSLTKEQKEHELSLISDFSHPSGSFSFNRAKRDFGYPKNDYPGPLDYEYSLRSSVPNSVFGRSKKGIVYPEKGIPGPGNYNPKRHFISK